LPGEGEDLKGQDKRLYEEDEGLDGDNEESEEENEGLDEENENKLSEKSETTLHRANTWGDLRFNISETNIRSSASKLDTLITPAARKDAEYPRHLDSDEESIEGSIFSERTEDTMASTRTDFSDEAEEATAAQKFLRLIAYDDLLRPLFNKAQEQSRFSAKAFEAKMRVLLKKFARDLRFEAVSEMQRKAMPFLYQRAGFVARRLTSLYYRQDELSNLYFGQRSVGGATQENDEENEKDENEEEDDVLNARQADCDIQVLFSHVELFLLSSAAFAKLRETVRRLLKPEQLSWAAVRDQWERELHFELPADIQLGCPVKIIIKDEITWADRFKSALEAYSGEEWLWELFKAPRRPVPEGKVRLQWQCVSIPALGKSQY
jgi:hypothetical protein